MKNYDKLLKSYNSYMYLINKKGLNIINKLSKWWYTKKIQLLKEKVSLVQTRIRVVERKICFEISSLYFENDYLDGKILYFFEYQKWVETFISDFEDKIENDNLKDIIRTLFTDTFRDEIFQRKNGVNFINVENSMEKFIYETVNSKEVLNFQTVLTNFKIVSKQIWKRDKTTRVNFTKNWFKNTKINRVITKKWNKI